MFCVTIVWCVTSISSKKSFIYLNLVLLWGAQIGFKLLGSSNLSAWAPKNWDYRAPTLCVLGLQGSHTVCSPVLILMAFPSIWAPRESLILCVCSHAMGMCGGQRSEGNPWALALILHSAFAFLPAIVYELLERPLSLCPMLWQEHWDTGMCYPATVSSFLGSRDVDSGPQEYCVANTLLRTMSHLPSP